MRVVIAGPEKARPVFFALPTPFLLAPGAVDRDFALDKYWLRSARDRQTSARSRAGTSSGTSWRRRSRTARSTRQLARQKDGSQAGADGVKTAVTPFLVLLRTAPGAVDGFDLLPSTYAETYALRVSSPGC